MKRIQVSIPEHLWREAQERAAQQETSGAQYIREAVLARVYYERALAGDKTLARALGLAKRDR